MLVGMFDWLRLSRASGLFTVTANIVTAVTVAVYAGGTDPRHLVRQVALPEAVWVLCCGGLLLLSGMIWNDWADVERDRSLHPRRPLASGRIAPFAAWLAALLLSSSALLIAALLGPRGVYAAGLVLFLALLYNFLTKQIAYIGSLTMGAVRAALALFALLALHPDFFDRAWAALLTTGPGVAGDLWCYPLLLAAYVTGVTLLSELESRRGRRCELLLAGGLVIAVLVLVLLRLLSAPWLHDPLRPPGTMTLVALGLFLAVGGWTLWRFVRPWWTCVRSARRDDVGPAVAAGLGGMILCDGLIAARAHPILGLAVLALFGPYLLASAMVRMD